MNKQLVVCAADLSNSPDTRQFLEENFQVRYIPATLESLCENLPDADAYYSCLEVRFTKELFDIASNLKVIATPSTGLDHIDLDIASQRGITVLGLKDDRELLDKITATAELAWSLVLASSRYLVAASNAASSGHWARDKYRGHQLAYKTLGILGGGRLGSIVAQYGKAFRMKVICYDVAQIEIEGVEQVSYDELLERSDVLSVHIHLNEQNKGFVDKKSIAKMKKGAVLVNTSRGAIVDEAALLQALKDGHLLAAGVDVIDGEWQENLYEHPMISYAREHDNLGSGWDVILGDKYQDAQQNADSNLLTAELKKFLSKSAKDSSKKQILDTDAKLKQYLDGMDHYHPFLTL